MLKLIPQNYFLSIRSIIQTDSAWYIGKGGGGGSSKNFLSSLGNKLNWYETLYSIENTIKFVTFDLEVIVRVKKINFDEN